MELDELNELFDLNELDLLYKLIDIAKSNESDAERILRGEKLAGVRVRNKLQDVRLICEIIRDKIQMRKDAKWSKSRIPALDKEIKLAQEREIKDKELLEKKKRERIAKAIKAREKKYEK